MRKKYFIIAALIIGMIAGVSSCKKKTVEPSGSNIEEKEPTEDQLGVKTKVETFVYGSGNQYYYFTAVMNRLENVVSTFNDSTTKAIVVFNNAVPSLTEQDYANIYSCYKHGGCVVACGPTKDNFSSIFRAGIINAAYKDNVLKYNTEGIERENWMKYYGNKLFRISSEVQNPEGALALSIGFHNRHKYILNSISDEVNPTTITNYRYGVMADGVAKWLNDVQSDEELSFKSLAGKGNNLSDLANAEIQTQEYAVDIDGSYEWSAHYDGVIQNTLTTYVSHSFDYDRDYYQVDQNITFRNGMISPAPDLKDRTKWFDWTASDGKNRQFIKSLDNFTSKMWLSMSGGGTTVVYDSHPQSANNTTTTTNGSSHSVSGNTGSFMGAGLRFFVGGFSLLFNGSMGLTKSYETNTGTSCEIQDLTVTKTTEQEDGYDKVNWEYQFRNTYTYENSKNHHTPDYKYWWAANLAMTDCSQQNSILFYVDHPYGDPTVNCFNKWKYVFSWRDNGTNSNLNKVYTEGCDTTTFTMTSPNRYMERWGISCVEYGNLTSPQVISNFENRITSDIIGGANNKFNYIGGQDQNDLTEVNNMLDLFISDFENMSESYAGQGYTGTFRFKLRGESTGREVFKEYTIVAKTNK